MSINIKGKSFLTLLDFTPEEVEYFLALGHKLKAKKKAGVYDYLMKDKNIVLLFDKTSTRTRSSFEVACHDEGAHVVYLASEGSQVGKKESIEDSAKVLGRFYDGIEYRGYEQSLVETLAEHAGVPVWNGLTDVDHPTQIIADVMTIQEKLDKPLSEVKVAFCGDIRNNMSYAWMYGCAKLGMHFVAYGPEELAADINQDFLAAAKKAGEETGATFTIGSTPDVLKGVDVLYTDIWASMGEEAAIPERVRLLTPYKITEELLAATENDQVIFMHCLPAFHDFETQMAKEQMALGYDIREVTDEVFRGPHSVVFDEAENRMHAIKAIMVGTLVQPEL